MSNMYAAGSVVVMIGTPLGRRSALARSIGGGGMAEEEGGSRR